MKITTDGLGDANFSVDADVSPRNHLDRKAHSNILRRLPPASSLFRPPPQFISYLTSSNFSKPFLSYLRYRFMLKLYH
jgi:hypothetical protein